VAPEHACGGTDHFLVGHVANALAEPPTVTERVDDLPVAHPRTCRQAVGAPLRRCRRRAERLTFPTGRGRPSVSAALIWSVARRTAGDVRCVRLVRRRRARIGSSAWIALSRQSFGGLPGCGKLRVRRLRRGGLARRRGFRSGFSRLPADPTEPDDGQSWSPRRSDHHSRPGWLRFKKDGADSTDRQLRAALKVGVYLGTL
jgi:hypothetical protein